MDYVLVNEKRSKFFAGFTKKNKRPIFVKAKHKAKKYCTRTDLFDVRRILEINYKIKVFIQEY